MTDQRDPRLPTGRPAVPDGRSAHVAPNGRFDASHPRMDRVPVKSGSEPGRPGPPRPPGQVPPQRYRPETDGRGERPSGPRHSSPRSPSGPPPRPLSTPSEYISGEMPLLTHEQTAAEDVARRKAATYDDRTGPPPSGRRRAPRTPSGSPTWRKVRRGMLAGLAVLILVPTIAFVIGYAMFETPNGEVKFAQVATFTFADGQTPLATVRPDNVNRVAVTLDQVPEHVRNAVLAAEDRSFFSNPGFDISGIARAVFNQLRGGIGGGSTITQQYVKVSTGDDDFSLWRKYKEVVLAVKVSREQTKQEILENYLNLIYLGRGAYGIQAASKAYFDKDVGQLTVSEGAMLAGVIQSPSRWDPAKNIGKSAERWNFVLDGMAAQGWISPTERSQQQFPDWKQEPPRGGGIPGDDRGHIYNLAKVELEQYGITETMINTQGLTITTTVDPVRQGHAVDAVTQVLKGQPENLRTALVSVDPRTGAIVSYYGGSNGVGTDYAQALRQPGSSFKPFVLAAALQGSDGVGLGTPFDGSSPQEFPGVPRPIQNSEGFDCDQCSVKTAMTRSINTIFYRMALDVGASKVIDAAHAAGIPENLLPEARGGIALGDQEVHPVDMAAAFATLAADGRRHPPYIVAKVTAADGRVLHSHEDDDTLGEQALPQQVARNVTEAMADVASFAGIGLGDRPVAAKTGTVQLPGSAGQNKDAWTVGFTPSLSTAVWVGTDLSEPIKNSSGRPVYGRMLPGSIWQAYMSDALRGTKVEQFSRFIAMGDPPVTEFTDEDGESSDESQNSDKDGFGGFGGVDSSTRDSSENRNSRRDGNGNGNGNGQSSAERFGGRFLDRNGDGSRDNGR